MNFFQQCTSVKYVQDEEYCEEDIVQDSQGTSEFSQEEDEDVTEDDYDVYKDVMRQEAGISETLSESTFQEGQKKCSTTRYIVYTLYNKNTTWFLDQKKYIFVLLLLLFNGFRKRKASGGMRLTFKRQRNDSWDVCRKATEAANADYNSFNFN